MRRAGVNDASGVVVYDAGGGLSAARAWWLLRYHGHGDVRLLDGGLAAWVAAGHAAHHRRPATDHGRLHRQAGAMPILDAAAAARLARDGVLLDARAAERYRGEVEPVDPVAGHVPGARSAPTTANLAADGTFLPRRRSAPDSRRSARATARPSARTAAPASPPPTRSSPSRSPASPRRCTPAHGASG